MSLEMPTEWSISNMPSSVLPLIGIVKLSAYLATLVSGHVELVAFLVFLCIWFPSLSLPDLEVAGEETKLLNVRVDVPW